MPFLIGAGIGALASLLGYLEFHSDAQPTEISTFGTAPQLLAVAAIVGAAAYFAHVVIKR